MHRFRKILITQSQVRNYSGSEIVTLEMAEYFSNIGSRVTILTTYTGDPIIKDFERLKNVDVVRTRTEEAENLDIANFDLVWIHHLTFSEKLLQQLVGLKKRPIVIFNHMSHMEPLEFPILYEAERSLADMVLFNSPRTYDELRDRGAHFDGCNVQILGNPAPDSFYHRRRAKSSGSLKKLAVVSNHPPDEVVAMSEILEKRGVTVDFIGRTEKGGPIRVTPELLQGYDVVVSIGKTVQYCILSNIPIYCYDRFGGSGFINMENYEKNRLHNFSGRGFKSKKPGEIADEITLGYRNSKRDHLEIHKKYHSDFMLSTKLNHVFSTLEYNNSTKTVKKIDAESYSNYIAIFNRVFPTYLSHSYNCSDRESGEPYKRLEALYRQEVLSHSATKQQLNAVLDSNSLKLGKMLLFVPNKLKSLLRSRNNKQTLNHALNDIYNITDKQKDINLGVVARNGSRVPSSSTFLRLLSPLSYGRSGKKVSVRMLSTNKPDVSGVDVCIVQRTAFNSLYEAKAFYKEASRLNVRIIVDTDDNFEQLDRSHPQFSVQSGYIDALNYIKNKADRIWVSTNRLAIEYKPKRTIYKNSVDDRLWKPQSKDILKNDVVRILCMGTATHDEDFRMVFKELDSLAEKYPGQFNVTVIGVSSDIPPRGWLSVLTPPRDSTMYPYFVQWFQDQDEFDVGIAPLANTDFNKAKSDIKVLDYLCLGVLPVVSDLEPYSSKELDRFIVRVGYGEQGWFKAIEDIILNKEKYSKQKRDSLSEIKNYISNNRSVRHISEAMLKEITELVSSRRKNHR